MRPKRPPHDDIIIIRPFVTFISTISLDQFLCEESKVRERRRCKYIPLVLNKRPETKEKDAVDNHLEISYLQ